MSKLTELGDQWERELIAGIQAKRDEHFKHAAACKPGGEFGAQIMRVVAIYDHMIAALDKAAPVGWQPIATAPRDGTNILIRFGQDGVSQAKYIAGLPYPWQFIDTNNGISWLINRAVDSAGGPSHWMPLPAARRPCATERSMSAGLLPCPFCRSEARIEFISKPRKLPIWEVCCSSFCVSISNAVEAEAIAAWNRRAPVQAQGVALPGCLADRLYEAISIARDRAQHAGSTPRMKKWDATADDLRAALAQAPQSEDARDGERLDFVLNNAAWIQGSNGEFALWTQNEDEEYSILSGIDKMFATPRDAIDAAIAALTGSGT